jgi:hypothetical protein
MNVKNAIKVLAIALALSATYAAKAQDAATQPVSAAKGRVTKVEGLIITVKSKAGETTITTDASTKFVLDGKPATLADVKMGERVVSVDPASGTATEVDLASAKKKKKKAAAPADGSTPAPAPAPAGN